MKKKTFRGNGDGRVEGHYSGGIYRQGTMGFERDDG